MSRVLVLFFFHSFISMKYIIAFVQRPTQSFTHTHTHERIQQPLVPRAYSEYGESYIEYMLSRMVLLMPLPLSLPPPPLPLSLLLLLLLLSFLFTFLMQTHITFFIMSIVDVQTQRYKLSIRQNFCSEFAV